MKRLIIIVSLLLAGVGAWAYDFSATAPSGQTLYFNIVGDGVELTCPGAANASGWNTFSKPTGALVLPSSVTNAGTTYTVSGIGRYAFYGCTGLLSVVVSEGVVTIGQAAFSGCISLDSVVLPSTVASLGVTSFYGCVALTALTCVAVVPPSLTTTTFGNINASNCTLYVPCQSVAAYASATGWSDFDIAVAGSCDATITALPNSSLRGSVSGTGTYTLGTVVTLTATPSDGFFFGIWSDLDTNNPRLVTLDSDTAFTAYFFPVHRDTVSSVDVQHDTVTLRDTLYVPVVHVDTIFLHDTLLLVDTILLTDTIAPTYFRLQVQGTSGGIGIGSAIVPAGTELEVGALPLEGFRFLSWDDGNTDNPRRVTLMGNTTLTATFVSVTGIDETQSATWTVSAEGRYVVVSGACGQELNLYDMKGNRLFHGRATSGRQVICVPAAGVYLVSVDGSAASKVTVIDR